MTREQQERLDQAAKILNKYVLKLITDHSSLITDNSSPEKK